MDNLSYSKGISWMGDARVPFVDDVSFNKKLPAQQGGTIYGGGKGFYRTEEITEYKEGGRFPANLLVCDDVLNDGLIYKSGKVHPHHKRNKTLGEYQGNAYGKFNNVEPELNYQNYYGDKGTNSRYYDLDKWFDKLLND